MTDQSVRVREARRALGLNQEMFGEKLGVRATAISKIENGENQLTEQMRRAINREFGVDYEWLSTGKGAMFVENDDALGTLIDELMKGEKETAKAVFKALARLGGDEWNILKKVILDIAQEIKAD